ncbi:MAG: nuclear transport factor 2 family protein [Bacteroidota bacterium]
MKKIACSLSALLIIWAFGFIQLGVAQESSFQVASESAAKPIHDVLDAWHQAASEANLEGYFNHFASDSAIFMGTDRTERWTVDEFRVWSKPYFDRGKAWSFQAVSRTVYLSNDGQTAWFDEQLDTPNLGPSRGSGVLVNTQEGWKIAHYNLSIPIPNPLVDSFVELIQVWENKKQ